jgi:HEAT repeat protein
MGLPHMSYLIAIVLLTPALVAHGGSYRGPGSTVPPKTGSSASAPGAPPGTHAQPGSPAPTQSAPGPATPATTVGRATVSATATPRGAMIGEDLSKWQYWWEFNQDSYLLLKDSLRATSVVAGSDEEFMGVSKWRRGHISAPPSRVDIDLRVVPALREALRTATNRDITSSCLVALAKIGRENAKFTLLPVFQQYLTSRDQEIRETAALAMGISQRAAATKTLIALATDTAVGRELTRRARVDGRTRSFATYALGLIAYAHRDIGVRMPILKAVRSILKDEALVDRNVKVAALNTLGLFSVDPSTNSTVRKLTEDAIRVLIEFYDADRGRGRDVVRAHVPTAVARLIGRTDSPLALVMKTRFVVELRPGARHSGLLQRSAALALGQMVLSPEKDKSEQKMSIALQKHFDNGKDGQARYFSLIALAQIGGAANRIFLLRVLKRGNRTLERPWAALALGCFAHNARVAAGKGLGVVDNVMAAAIHKAFNEGSTPYARGAMAISLGLCGHRDAAGDLLKRLTTHGHQDEMSGYVCVGLALMKYEKALQPIVDVLDNSVRRPHRMRMAAIALGKLGDRRVADRLLSMLKEKEPSLAKMAAVASALSQIGDRNSIDPLREMLLDKDLPSITRAFAAVALGGIADKEPVPWNAKIAVNMNYRAAVETLVESGAGVLEIL